MFLSNIGTRVQEVADLRVGHLELGGTSVGRLHGKGDEWRTCPLWRQTTEVLSELVDSRNAPSEANTPVFSLASVACRNDSHTTMRRKSNAGKDQRMRHPAPSRPRV